MIRWGIIGAGGIAKRFLKSLSHSENGIFYAIASLTPSKQQDYRLQYPDIQVYGSYEEIINDENVDAIYIANRHKDHYQWAKEALKHKKAVLCEKPATLSYRQTKELCDLAKENNVLFLEGMKTRFVPLVYDIKELLNQKVIGDVVRVETCFAYNAPYREGHYLHDVDQGGILYDVSSYNLASIIDYISSPLQSIESKFVFENGVDANDQIELLFESGQSAYIDIAMNENKEKIMTIYGTEGKITAVPFYRPEEIKIELNNGESYTKQKSYIYDDFYTEIEEVHSCINQHLIESPRMTHQDSLKIIEYIEKIKETFK